MNQIPTTPQPLQSVDIIRSKIAAIDVSLVSKVPGQKAVLNEIHKAVHANEALVYLLTLEEIGKITSCLMDVAQMKIMEAKVKAASKGKTTSGKKLSELSLDDI